MTLIVSIHQLRDSSKLDLCKETKCSLAPAYWRAIEGQTSPANAKNNK